MKKKVKSKDDIIKDLTKCLNEQNSSMDTVRDKTTLIRKDNLELKEKVDTLKKENNELVTEVNEKTGNVNGLIVDEESRRIREFEGKPNKRKDFKKIITTR